jgi:hypothetical protein
LPDDGTRGDKSVDHKVTSLIDKAQVLERDPEELSSKVVEELIAVVQRVEKPEQASNGAKATYWVYRAPFAGVRYYSYE